MKKFNKPEIELIVLDSTDTCTTSPIPGTPATDSVNSINSIGEINMGGEVKLGDNTIVNLDDTFANDMFFDN